MSLLRERQVIGALLYLPARVRKRFQEFLASPYFRVGEDLQELYRGLENYFFKGKRGPELSEQDFWSRLAPGEPFDQGRFTQVMYRLGEKFEEFLAIEQFQSRSNGQEGFALREMLGWQMEKLYEKKARKQRKELRKRTVYSWQRYLDRFEFLLNDASYLISGEDHSSAANELDFLLHQLDQFTHLTRLKIVASSLDWGMTTGRTLLEFPAFPSRNISLASPPTLNDLYCWIVELLVAERDGDLRAAAGHYSNFKVGFAPVHAQLNQDEFDDLTTYAMNFVVRHRLAPEPFFSSDEEFSHWAELRIQTFLKRGKVIWREGMNYGTYLLQGRKFREVEVMVKKMRGKIVGDPEEQVLGYLEGLGAYLQGKFPEALRHFNQIFGKSGDMLDLDLMVRLMRLRTYFELKDWTGCLGDTESFRLKVIRSKKHLADTRYRALLNFIRFARRTVLLLDDPMPSPHKRDRLIKEVQAEPALSKPWLLEQLAPPTK